MTLRSRSFALFAMLGAAMAGAQTPSDPLVKQDFKDGQGGWTKFGDSATLAVSHDAPVVAPGDGALKFAYTVNKGDMSALVFPVQQGTLTRAKSLKFRVHTDAQTVVAVMLQEQDGGRYLALCMAPKNSWQPIELSTDDFWLADGPNDPKDPDGKLDMDQVSGIMVTDLAQMFAQSDDENLKGILSIQTGSHALFLDQFSVSPDSAPTEVKTTGSDVFLETFAHPQLSWFPLGGGELTAKEGGLSYAYHQSPGKVSLVSHAVPPGSLTGAKSLSLELESQQPARLIVQIEQTDGGKYQMPVDLDGGTTSKHLVLSFDSFAPSDDSRVKEGKADLSKVKTVTILDASGILSQADKDNVLKIRGIVAHK